jgi:hypothetical protein
MILFIFSKTRWAVSRVKEMADEAEVLLKILEAGVKGGLIVVKAPWELAKILAKKGLGG